MKNGYLLLLAGETARGKDTVARYLKKTRGLIPVCSYTDRPMRPKETNGVEHYFVSEKQADALLRSRWHEVCAYTQIGIYRYWTFVKNLEDADIYIIDPNGIIYLKEHFPGIPTKTVYVTCPDDIAFERAKKRGDKENAIIKRMNSEYEQFKSFPYDVCIHNDCGIDDLKKSVDRMIDDFSK